MGWGSSQGPRCALLQPVRQVGGIKGKLHLLAKSHQPEVKRSVCCSSGFPRILRAAESGVLGSRMCLPMRTPCSCSPFPGLGKPLGQPCRRSLMGSLNTLMSNTCCSTVKARPWGPLGQPGGQLCSWTVSRRWSGTWSSAAGR